MMMYGNFILMKRTMPMIKVCFCLFFVLLSFVECQQNTSNEKQNATHIGQMYVTVEPFKTATGWGYNIYTDKKLYIQQTYIPGVQGNHSFATREDAEKVGKLAVQKMEAYHKMPYISPQDLQQLNIQLPH